MRGILSGPQGWLSRSTIDWTLRGYWGRSNPGRGGRPRGPRCTLWRRSRSRLLRRRSRICRWRWGLIVCRRLLSHSRGWIPVPIRMDASPLGIILLIPLCGRSWLAVTGGPVRSALVLLGVIRVVRIATARVESRTVELLFHWLLKLTAKSALPEDGLHQTLTEHNPLQCNGQCQCQR